MPRIVVFVGVRPGETEEARDRAIIGMASGDVKLLRAPGESLDDMGSRAAEQFGHTSILWHYLRAD